MTTPKTSLPLIRRRQLSMI